MLSLETMYAASLVFKYREQPNKDLERLKLITIKWKIEELSVCSTHASELIANNWYKIKMWHFINDGPNADFDIVIEELSYCEDPMESELLIQGIEFHPIEMMQHEKNEEDHDDDDDDDEYWENKLPNDYQRLIQSSDKPLHYTNKKDLYLRLSTSILHNDYNYKRLERLSLPESRFGEVKKLQEAVWYTFEC
nr:serine-threonine/tyrosine-protein kinase catalytic domain-containing protein [Tanacetum cinerariifolium]